MLLYTFLILEFDFCPDTINYPVKLFCENFLGENREEELPQEESRHEDKKSEFTFGIEERTARSTVSSGEIFLEDSQQAEEGGNEQLFSMVSVAAATKPVQSARIIHPTGEINCPKLFNSSITPLTVIF